MPKNIIYILYLILVLPFIAGCSEGLYIDETVCDSQEELPIEFDFQLPDTQGTRGVDGQVKTAFKNGDVIHILATFKTEELQSDGSTKESEVKRYGALRLEGKIWKGVEGNKLTWPSVAVDGTFEAYYIPKSNGLLTEATEVETYKLSEIKPVEEGDPLHAKSEKYDYGYAVSLEFKHKCAYLTLIDLEPQVSETYWLTRGDTKFNNAFRLNLVKDSDNNPDEFKFEFCQMPEEDYYSPDNEGSGSEKLVCIKAPVITPADGNETTITKANYFLEPGDYTKFSLCYPAIAPNVHKYLTYDFSQIPEKERPNAATSLTLEEGKAYSLTITKSPGVTINSPSSDDGWDETDSYIAVDVEKFLAAVCNNSYNPEDDGYYYEYKDADGQIKRTKILERVGDNGCKLLHNIDFQNFNYSDLKEVIPNISAGNVFDGDSHYIKNLASPLFRYNNGTIKNVGIRDVNIEADSNEDKDANKDMSRHGALCMRNEATINNVRVRNVTMTISVKDELQVGGDGSEVHNIGGVLGSNTGTLSGVALGEKFILKVNGVDENINAQVLIGGIVGQNTATINDVSPLDNKFVMQITNSCVGTFGSYSVGGVVGESSGNITSVILSDVKIDGEGSKCTTSYMGGIAGQLSVEGTARLESCIVDGSVAAGTVVKYGNLTSASYIGGIAGADYNVSVLDCRTAVSVRGSQSASDNVIYATGGAFGRIRNGTQQMSNIIAYGSALNGPNDAEKMRYIGNFAGIVPVGQKWEDDYSNNNILIRTFGEYKNIGGELNSNNNQ